MKKILFSLVICFLINVSAHSQCAGNCTLYTVSNIPVNLSPNAGTAVTLGDDAVSAAIPIGFTFNFFCNNYTNLYIVSNGFISFNPAVASGCCSGQICPTAGGNPDNYVAFAWNDLYPPGNGTIKYQTLGVTPNRIFVVTYSLIPFCCGAGPPNVSGQIKLYETTNIIEVHNATVGNQGSNQTQGIMNAGGTAGFPAPGRNAVAWTANNDAYRWSPSPPLTPCAGTPTAGTAAASPTTACSSYTSNLSLPGLVWSCNLTYQWQSAPAIGGPYTNIAGATFSVANVTNNATTFYRCIVSCGASTVASGVATCTIPTCSGAPTGGNAVSSPTTGCGTLSSTLTLSGASCGLLTYQWQSATAIGGPYANIGGATSGSLATTNTVTTYYRCIVACGASTAASVPATCSVSPGPCATGVYYVNSNVGQPWGTNTNWTSLNAVFSNTWVQTFYQTANTAAMFSPTTCLIFLEGGDNNAIDMNTWVTANIAGLQNWVNAGGHLLMNAAPNQGGNMNWGFGGVVLNYAGGPLSSTGVNAAGQAGHAIFNGPALPCGTSYTGNWWSHANITGPVTDLVDGTGGITFCERTWGAGKVMFGGMTTPNWHLPAPNAQNFLSNILSYLACPVTVLPIELINYDVNYVNKEALVFWETVTEKNSNYYLIEKSYDGQRYEFVAKVAAAGTSNTNKYYSVNDENPNRSGITYYRLKQFDKGDTKEKFTKLVTLNLDEKANELMLVPNPASTNVVLLFPKTLSGKALNLEVYDDMGKRVMDTKLNESESGSTGYNFNISNLPAGIYIVKVSDDEGTMLRKKLVKN